MAYNNGIKRIAMKSIHVDKRTLIYTCEHLLISLTTLKRWLCLYKEGKLYEVKPRSRKGRKVNDEALVAYVSEYPDAYLEEIARVFGMTNSGIYRALKRLGVSRKKKLLVTQNVMFVNEQYIRKV